MDIVLVMFGSLILVATGIIDPSAKTIDVAQTSQTQVKVPVPEPGTPAPTRL